jgi:hypothetical protein
MGNVGEGSGSVLTTSVNRATVWTLSSARDRADPWSEIALFATLRGPGGEELRIPGYWDGERTWRFRVSAPTPGRWTLESACDDASDEGLDARTAELRVLPADTAETNVFVRHGAVGMTEGGAAFAHRDGTPFHWLADTWWMLMSERVAWPEDFGRLVDHRKAQGFTAVQVVVGFPPDTTPFDGRDANAGGSPWLTDYASINPAYFQAVDRRLERIIDAGLLPCILGGWGYHLLFMGKQRMLAHWRYLVARYGAWPVVWCLAGEGAMPYYLSKHPEDDVSALKAAWPEVARFVKGIDPYRRPVTLHPRRHSWDDTLDADGLDFHMTQAGHLPNAPRLAIEALAIGRDRFPGKAIVNAEPPYEGHAGANWEDVQRYSFWSSMLSGAAGFTYGAAGVFQANDKARPTGDRPDGGGYDLATWDEAIHWPGARQVAGGHALLAALGYHRFSVHPEWASIRLRFGAEAYALPPRAFAAGIPGEVRVIYLPLRWYHWDGPLLHALEPGLRYRAAYVDTATFARTELGEITGDAKGEWQAPTLPYMHDWVLVLTRA